VEFNSQVISFVITIAAGIVLGVLFDCYRVLRGTFRPKCLMTCLTDLLYWLVATVIVFLALILSNWGELRFYVFLGILSGVGLYYRLLSVYAIRLFIGLIRLVKSIVVLIGKIINGFFIRPVLVCIKILTWPFQFVGNRLRTWYHIRYPKPPKDEKIE
jgi:spore cortex biosynthesis protein YabQ